MPPAPTLRRDTFKTSRLAEFCSRRELVNQTGHAVEEWPFVILKELFDNALDACEEALVAPLIDVAVSDDGIIISDNGPGLSPEIVADMLDYTSRVSSREAYASPTRGAQGNALKTILAMPFALARRTRRGPDRKPRCRTLDRLHDRPYPANAPD